MMGVNSNDPDEFTRADTKVLKPLAKAGAAVIGVDHLPKNPASRLRGPTGTGAKNRAVGGVSLRVVLRRQFVPGKGGTADLYVKKDRPGGLRQHCPPAREQEAADSSWTPSTSTAPPAGAYCPRWVRTRTRRCPPPPPPTWRSSVSMLAGTFTVRDVAVAHAGEEAVIRADLDRAHYHIEALTKAGLVIVVSTTRGGAANR